MDKSASYGIFMFLFILGSCCENPYVEVGSKCIFFASTLDLDYQASEEICNALNGKLTTINSPNLLWDIVKHVQNDSTIAKSYWIDGKSSEDKWVYNDGSEVPSGTPYWATFLNQNQELEQQPEEGHGEDLCLAIEDGSSYYFTPSACADLKSPLCEELTGTTATATAPSAVLIKDACGGGELTSFAGEITSPRYPDGYPDVGHCEWTINRGDSGDAAVIRITVQDLDLAGPGSSYGYLRITDGPDGSAPTLGYYDCDNLPATPFDLVTSGPTAFIRFYSGHDVADHRGFRLQYTTEQWNGDCNIAYNTSTGSIYSPWYPTMYPPNTDCRWTIIIPDGSFIALTVFTFDTQKDVDIVQIRDGATSEDSLIAEMSGTIEYGYEITSTSNSMLISFSTDNSVSGKGFTFTWTSKELCPSPYLNVGQLCLHFIFNTLTFGQSSISCREEKGELAAINDPQDLRDLYLFLHDNDIADTSFWLGGSDVSDEGLWRWQDNSLVPTGTPFWGTTGYYSEVQEPDGGAEENCLMLRSSGFYFFRDQNCTTKAPAICMY